MVVDCNPCKGRHCDTWLPCAVQEEVARRERLLRARASLAEEQRGNAARATRREAAGERLAVMQVDSSHCIEPSAHCFRLLCQTLPVV